MIASENVLDLESEFFSVFHETISEVIFLQQGVVVSGLIIYIQLWCMEEKGPVFVTMFNPLSTIIVAVLAYFALDEKLYMGRYISNVHFISVKQYVILVETPVYSYMDL